MKVATNYGNRATGVGTKHAVSRPRPILGLEIKTETLDFRSQDQDRDLGHQVSRPRLSFLHNPANERTDGLTD